MLRLLYTQATTAAQSAPSRVPMPVSAPTRRLLHDGPGLAMAQPRAHPYLGDGGPSADYLQRSRIRGSGRRDVVWAKRFRFCSGAPPRSRRRRTASREFAQRVDSRSVREMRTAKLRSFPRKRESRPKTWVPATGSPRRERRGVPLAGTGREGWFLPLPGNQNTHSSVVVYSAARTLASKPYRDLVTKTRALIETTRREISQLREEIESARATVDQTQRLLSRTEPSNRIARPAKAL